MNREEFERWYVENRQAAIGSRDCNMAWEGWQARGEQIAARLRERAAKFSEDMSLTGCTLEDELRSLADEIGGKW